MARATENARSYLIPAPTGGWNTRDPWYAMPKSDATVLDNMIPDSSYCRSFGGQLEYADIGSGVVHTLATLVVSDGTEYLVGINSAAVVNATAGGAGSGITGAATVTSGVPWQWVTFRNILFMVNGTDQPLSWTGTGNVTATAWTGPTIANLINVAAYKRRLYFVEKNTAKMWYTEAVDNVSGALVSFDVQSLLTKGGLVLYAGPTSRSTSQTPNEELFTIVSDQGEVLVYSGDNPKSGTWNIVAHYYMGRAIGRRCCFHVGGDLNIISYDGLVPMSQLLSGIDPTNDYQTVSGKIRPSFIRSANSYASNRSWCGVFFPSGPYVLVNIPLVDFSAGVHQYLMNTTTKAWCRITGAQAAAWATFKPSGSTLGIFFGSAEADGKIYRADLAEYLGRTSTGGGEIAVDIQHAFSPLEDNNNDKIVDFVQPYIDIKNFDTAPTTSTTLMYVGISADYNILAVYPNLTAVNLTGTKWLTSDQGGVNNKPIADFSISGSVLGLRINGNAAWNGAAGSKLGVQFRYYTTRVFYHEGSQLA